MTFVLDAIASDECRHEIDLRGEKLCVRWVPAEIQRKIEELIPYPAVHGDPRQVELHKAKPAYQAQIERTKYLRQCLRTAYAGDMEVRGLSWSDQLDTKGAHQIAQGVAQMLTDAEIATIMDYVLGVNLFPPFGTFERCQSPINPLTISATAAALGVFTPGACTPIAPAPWIPGSDTVNVRSLPALDKDCSLICAYGGIITPKKEGQDKVKFK